MVGIRTYNERYKQADISKYRQADIELEIIVRLISGLPKYQQLIYTYTCKNMFIDKDLRTIYEIITNYIKDNSIKTLNPDNLIFYLKSGNLKYVKFIDYINHLDKEYYTHSADTENWLIFLHKSYEQRLYAECKSGNDYRQAETELSKYRLENLECNLLDTGLKYLDDYETKSESLIKTCYSSIDNLIGGLQGGNLMILAAATGMGKTAIALNFVLNMAKNNKRILLFSLEMTADELLNRIIAIETAINAENLRNRALTQSELDKYVQYLGSNEFATLQNRITIPTKNRISIAKIEEVVRKSDADIVFIDYLGLIQSDIKTNTYEQISDVSRRLKLLAIETNKPFVVLHQLNRDMKSRSDKHPTLSDIRDSGKIEQDADFITFVYRPSYYDNSKDKTDMEFMIAKSRHTSGAGRIVNLIFTGRTQKISDTKRG